MSAIYIKGENINLSFSYNVLTFYAKTISRYHLENFFKHISTLTDVENIQFNDSKHQLCHHDPLNSQKIHFHLKLSEIPTRVSLYRLLSIARLHRVINESELKEFFSKYDNRNLVIVAEINNNLTSNKALDCKMITNLIAKIEDMEVLAFLHNFLSSQNFDYLRAVSKPNVADNILQSKAHKTIGEKSTSEEWAMLEKTISIQMITIITERMRPDEKVYKHIAHELSDQFKFFSMKRNANKDGESKLFKSFVSADINTLEDTFDKHSRKFK